jgi:hypothetical protein
MIGEQMETINEMIWIVFFIAAILVRISKRGNIFIIFALIGYGLNSFLFTLVNWDMLDYSVMDELYSILRLLPVIASILLVIGVLSLIRSSSPTSARSSIMQDAHGVSLATLFTPRNDTNTYSRAEVLRDEACDRLVARAKKDNLKIIEQRSQSHSPTVWFRLDYMIPSSNPDLSLTTSVAVDIERFDFHRFELTFNVKAQVGSRIKTVQGVIALDDSTIDRIHGHIVTPGKKLRLTNRVRKYPWEFWRPKNKIRRLRRDWVAIGLPLIGLLFLLIPYIGVLLMACVYIGILMRKRQRQTFVLTSGKPLTDPRALLWMDSWQVSIFGLGDFASTIQQGIITRLSHGGPQGASIKVEKIGYWGTDSWVEREQVVINHRRAIGFVHVVPYKDELYVGWESHLNSASWIEEKLAEGVDRVSGHDVVANRVIAGWHRLNEYDISDSNFLAEWVHEAVKREIKLRMAEHEIDQEIDFTVQRESRKDALSSSLEAKSSDKKTKTKKFKRID